MNQAIGIASANAAGACSRSISTPGLSALIGGGAIALFGLSRRSRLGLAMAAAGGALAYAGIKASSHPQELVANSSILLNCTPQEAYRLWRNFEDLPLFMRHLDSVTQIGERRYRWVAIGPLGSPLRWDAEIVGEREGESISWRSLPGSEISTEGIVEFRTAPASRGTLLNAIVIYRPPAGKVGNALAKVLGKDPNFLMRQDLRRFKALVETGEIPTIEGQPHGPRSAVAAAARLLNPDEPVRRDARIREVFAAKRRTA